MIPDIEQIRAALAAAAKEDDGEWTDNSYRDRAVLRANAPVWLAQCLTEIERLQDARASDLTMANAEIERLRADFSDAVRGENDALVRTVRELEAERDAALLQVNRLLAEIERLREINGKPLIEWVDAMDRVVAEKDAALAECERLRKEVDGLLDELSRCQCERVGDA